MNVLHCCGWEGIPNRLEDWADYKTAVVSWARYIEGLDVKEAKENSDGLYGAALTTGREV